MVEPAKIQSPNKGSKKYTRTRFNPSLIIILSLTYLTVIPATNAVQINLVGQVSTVQDGYTFTLNSGQTIRLADIEIPGVNQRGYEQAKTTLANLVNGKTVYLTQSSLYGDIDGRLICVAYVEYDSQNYLNVNKKMIDSAFATPLDTRNDFTPSTWTLLIPKNPQPPPVTYTLTIQAPNGSGSTDPTTDNYAYNQVVTVPIQAYPASGWILDHWMLDGANVGNQNPYLVYMNVDHQFKAVFTQSQTPSPLPTTYILLVQNSDGAGSTDPVPANYNYPQAASVLVEAIPQSGWQLDHWMLDGINVGNVNPINVNVNKDRTIKAVFTQTPTSAYTLIIENPVGSGSTDPYQGSYTYKNPVGVAVKATPAVGWVFDHWIIDGVNAGSVNPLDLVLAKNHQLKAVFTQGQATPPPQTAYTLILQSPEGSGSTDPPTGSYTYQNPVRVVVRAAPASGWIFDHWILDGTEAGKSNPREVVMNANHSVKAVFVTSGSNPSIGIPSYPLESVIIGILLCIALITYGLSLHNQMQSRRGQPLVS